MPLRVLLYERSAVYPQEVVEMSDVPHAPQQLPGAARARQFAEPPDDQPHRPVSQAAPTPTSLLPEEPDFSDVPGGSTPEPPALEPSAFPLPSTLVDNASEGSGPPVGWDRFAANAHNHAPGGTPKPVHAPAWTPAPVVEKPAEWGRRPLWIRVLSLGLAHAKASPAELEYRHNVRAVRQQAWPRCVRIVVANPKGGVGKTPTALLLGGMLAQVRGGGVVVWDANQSAGTLRSRAEGMSGRSVAEVASDPVRYSTPGGMAAAVLTQSSFADVLGSGREPRHLDQLAVQRVQYALDRTYRLSVADTGGNEGAADPCFRELMESADQLIVPLTATQDALEKAQQLLHEWRGLPSGLAQRAVVAVMNSGGPTTPGLAEQLAGVLSAQGVNSVVHIPYDRAIAAGTTLTVGDLSHDSVVAWTRLAAATVSNIIVQPERA